MILAVAMAALIATAAAGPVIRLPVPAIRQAPERCGPAALGMVMRYYGADSAALAGTDGAYDPALRGSLITDLARCARNAGFAAEVVTLAPDSLAALLALGVPPILRVRNGIGPVTRPHYAVVVGWDPARRRWEINDGAATTRGLSARDLERRWRGGDYQALIVRPGPEVAPHAPGGAR